MKATPYNSRFEKALAGNASPSKAEVTVAISLYNYQDFILDALESVRAQTLEHFDLVVVDDKSTDRSLSRTKRWLDAHAERFRRVALVSHRNNAGLPAARDTAFELAKTDFVFVLDADNELYPRCLGRCLDAIRASGAAFVFPTLEIFGARQGLLGYEGWDIELLKRGNYIDAMSLIRVSAWREVGGYSRMNVTGWEDYELWCKFVERGFFGLRVPEILARYRDHETSMLNTTTNPRMQAIRTEMQKLHPWLLLEHPVS